jgi:hypothetical protein
MAKEAILPNNLGLGRVVLLATDSVGMACEGAFWIYDNEEAQWQFYLVTSMIDAMGPRQIYLLLDKALSKRLSEEEVENFTIYVTSPTDPLARLISKQISTDRRATVPMSLELMDESKPMTVIVYRLSTGLQERQIKKAQKRFQKLSDLEVA